MLPSPNGSRRNPDLWTEPPIKRVGRGSNVWLASTSFQVSREVVFGLAHYTNVARKQNAKQTARRVFQTHKLEKVDKRLLNLKTTFY